MSRTREGSGAPEAHLRAPGARAGCRWRGGRKCTLLDVVSSGFEGCLLPRPPNSRCSVKR
eukprot:11324765-Alexandrium_andersonii.AAC.1